jgi:anti-anti-sigma factor
VAGHQGSLKNRIYRGQGSLESLELYLKNKRNLMIVELKGRLNYRNVLKLKKELYRLIKRSNKHLYLDVNRLEEIDSCAIGVLIGLERRLAFYGRKFGIIYSTNKKEKILSLNKMIRFFVQLKEDVHLVETIEAPTTP